MLWFIKGLKRKRSDVVVDCLPSERSKSFHKWEQGISEAKNIFERITRPNDLVCDFFIGSGTGCVAAKSLGRRRIGCDNDKDAVATARARLSAM